MHICMCGIQMIVCFLIFTLIGFKGWGVPRCNHPIRNRCRDIFYSLLLYHFRVSYFGSVWFHFWWMAWKYHHSRCFLSNMEMESRQNYFTLRQDIMNSILQGGWNDRVPWNPLSYTWVIYSSPRKNLYTRCIGGAECWIERYMHTRWF